MAVSVGKDDDAFGGGFFDRVVTGVAPRETPAEVQDCHSQLRICKQRMADMEIINKDLEARLEAQACEYIELESDAAESLQHWKAQYNALSDECEKWKQLHGQQELRNKKIREQLLRTERELHGILRKKYDIIEYARREERERIQAEQSGTLPAPASASKEHSPKLPERRSKATVRHNPLTTSPQDVRR
eukprot:CAMPEP_0119281510 /NCGR_PEP_ID=MMETSP1329-20130426/24846_1 /TAXON_ID=114041 /ORGANISM="Genus nov. species nov., Strain RCC1024" /LENGTH=188 /DNA_ID=CAMNT_0007282131 /DNA_START=276 /DNA_END=839 /DNA_ORIENTATION=-